jgi:hypothetical protein
MRGLGIAGTPGTNDLSCTEKSAVILRLTLEHGMSSIGLRRSRNRRRHSGGNQYLNFDDEVDVRPLSMTASWGGCQPLRTDGEGPIKRQLDKLLTLPWKGSWNEDSSINQPANSQKPRDHQHIPEKAISSPLKA